MNQNGPQTEPSTFDVFDNDLRFLANPSHILLALADAQGECEFVSPSWLAFTGRIAKQEWGQGWRELVHPDDRTTLDLALKEALHAQFPFRLQFRYQCANGSYRRLVAIGMVRSAPDGGFTGHIF